jgi:hypothetical protein
MRIGVIGAGRIGGGAARLWAAAGHEVVVGGRDPGRAAERARELGAAGSGTVTEATAFGDVVVLSVPWVALDDVLAEAGPALAGRVVIDTTNPYGPGGLVALPAGRTAAQVVAARMPGARYTKSLNTLTAAFQAESARRTGADRAVQWVCGDDPEAKAVTSALLADAGWVPVDVGGTADSAVMEAPRRPGAVYGEEYREPEARAVVEALRAGRPIPPAPSY